MGVTVFRFLIVLCAATLAGVLALLRTRRDLGDKTKSIEAVVLLELLVTLCYLAENVVPTLGAKVFWDSVQLGVDCLLGWAFLTFSLRYSGRRFPSMERTAEITSLGLGLFAFLFTWLGHQYGFVRQSAYLTNSRFVSLRYDFELVDYLAFFYLYFLLAVSIPLLFASGTFRHQAFRREILLLGAGVFLPSLVGLLTVVSIHGERDLSPFYFAAGNLIAAYGVLTGRITSAFPMNRDLLVEAQTDAIVLTEASGHVVDANGTAKHLLGDRLVIGHQVGDAFPETQQFPSERFRIERLSRIWEFQKMDLAGERTLFVGREVTEQANIETERAKLHGELEEKVRVRTLELEAANEQLRSEIESRRIAEITAIENASNFRAIFDNSAFLLALLDGDGRILELNRSASEVTQVSANTSQHLPFAALELWKKASLSATLERHHAAALAGNIEVFELQLAEPTRRVLDCRMKPFQSRSETHVLFEAQDVTTLRELAENRAHLQTMLAHSDRMDMLGRLAGGVAHDFNNLLTVILGAAEMLQSSNLSENDRNATEEIMTAGEQASMVTRQLLAFSRIGGSKPTLLDAHAAIHQLTKIYDRLVGEKHNLELTLTAPLASIEIVPGHLEQCLTNLVVNARDAMPKGGTIRIETTLARAPVSDSSGAYLKISVIDNGIGMAPALRDRIFDAYFTTKPEGKGTGLGLHTVQTLVSEAHGFVRIESEVGQGSNFALYFPIVDAQVVERARVVPKTLTGSETLLVVEDLAPLRERSTAELRRLGYDVFSAPSAEAALETLSQMAPLTPHALVTDVMLPGEDGTLLAQRIRKLFPNIPVIFTTGYAGDKELIVRESPRMYLLYKPYRVEQLASLLRQALDEGPHA